MRLGGGAAAAFSLAPDENGGGDTGRRPRRETELFVLWAIGKEPRSESRREKGAESGVVGAGA